MAARKKRRNRRWIILAVLALAAGVLVAVWPRRWTVTGVAATTTLNDMDFCFDQSLLEDACVQLRARPVVEFNHDTNVPIGHIVHIQMVGDEMRVAAVVLPCQGRFWRLIRGGAVIGFSIGMSLGDFETDVSSSGELVRRYTKAKVAEVSVTSEPADSRAMIWSAYTDWYPWDY